MEAVLSNGPGQIWEWEELIGRRQKGAHSNQL